MAQWKRLIFVATGSKTPDKFKEELCKEAKNRNIEEEVRVHTYGTGKAMFSVDTCNEDFASHIQNKPGCTFINTLPIEYPDTPL